MPLGFIFAAAYLWLAQPTWPCVSAGVAVILAGLAIRAAASGHIRKNRELATTGPYAYTRNPLYLGSLLIGLGFVIAARDWWIAAGALLMFVAIYVPVIGAEERYLRQTFAGYQQYAAQVPRLLPRATPYRSDAVQVSSSEGSFSRELYLKHREYQAGLGSALMIGALILKMIFIKK